MNLGVLKYSMNVTILGNGPSRERWDGSGDIIIGCHGGEGVDYLCTIHPEQGWQPIPTIQGVTKRIDVNPHTPLGRANFEWGEDQHVDRIQVDGLLVALPKGRSWDTGSVAVLWALYTYRTAQINLWGFDSLWSSQYTTVSENVYGKTSWNTWGGPKRWMRHHPRIRVCGELVEN